jgi:heme-degrading monooxygenase HmoA
VIRTLLRLRALGRRDELVEAFQRLDVLRLSSATPGFISSELHVSDAEEDVVLVTALWQSPASYEDWRACDTAQRLGLALDQLSVSDTPIIMHLHDRIS